MAKYKKEDHKYFLFLTIYVHMSSCGNAHTNAVPMEVKGTEYPWT